MYKPINSKEAVDDAIKQQLSPLFVCDYDGTMTRRNPGKDPNQTWFSVSRNPKPTDESKPADKNNPFIKHLLSVNNGEIDLDLLYANCMKYDINKPAPVSLYDTIKISIKGKPIDTTVGRLLLNKAMLFPVLDHPRFNFLNEVCTYKKLDKIWRLAIYCEMEGSLPKGTTLDLIESSNEFGLRLSTVVNAGVTMTMMNPDSNFIKMRDQKLRDAKIEFIKTGDYSILDKAEKDILAWVKDYFKDDDMMELYDSMNSAKLDNDWKNMNVMMGTMPDLAGGKPVLIDNALIDGIDPKFLPNITNVAMIGAMDRALNTAYAGTIGKDLSNGTQSIKGIRGDCGSTKTKKFKSDNELDYVDKYIMENGKPILITLDNMMKYVGKEVNMRYPVGCKQKDGHFCSTCLGEFMFKTLKSDIIPIGLYVSEIGSKLLNVLMRSTHNLGASVFKIKNWNDFIYPRADLFEHKIDPLTEVEKVYCKKDIKWVLPESAIEAVDTYYKVLAHGSVLEVEGDQPHTIVFGSDIGTNPSEIIKPKPSEADDDENFEKHVIFMYKAGDCFLNTTTSVRYNMTVYRMLKVFFGGNISNLVPLETHLDTLKNNFKANIELGAADLSLEILVASLARDYDNPSKTARETGNSKYKFISLYELGVIGGTFNAVFGPDAGKALMITLAKSEQEQTKTISPMEKALRY